MTRIFLDLDGGERVESWRLGTLGKGVQSLRNRREAGDWYSEIGRLNGALRMEYGVRLRELKGSSAVRGVLRKGGIQFSIVSGEGEVYGVRRSDPDAWPWLQTLP
jgi:hypothetical protein